MKTNDSFIKTDISLPDSIYETSERLAQQLGMSLSDFLLAALTAYIAKYQMRNITDQLNQLYETEPSSLDPGLTSIQVASLDHDTW